MSEPTQSDINRCKNNLIGALKTMKNGMPSYHSYCGVNPLFSGTCPYCAANHKKCDECGYSRTHGGKCEDHYSTWWRLAVDAMGRMATFKDTDAVDATGIEIVCERDLGLFSHEMTLDEFMDCKRAFLREVSIYFPNSDEFRVVLEEY